MRVDGHGQVKEALETPQSYSDARGVFGTLRFSKVNTEAMREGGCFELRVGGVAIRVETCIKRPAPSTRRCPSRLGSMAWSLTMGSMAWRMTRSHTGHEDEHEAHDDATYQEEEARRPTWFERYNR